MEPMPRIVESIWVYERGTRDPLLLAHAVLTVSARGVWHIRQVVRTGWCQTDTVEEDLPDEAAARAMLDRLRAEWGPAGDLKTRLPGDERPGSVR